MGGRSSAWSERRSYKTGSGTTVGPGFKSPRPHGQSSAITTLSFILLTLLIATFLYMNLQPLLFQKKEQTDVYLKYSKLTELQIRIFDGRYSIKEYNGKTFVYVSVTLTNDGPEPVFYRVPILGTLYLIEQNSYSMKVVSLDVNNSTSYFIPGATYILTGITEINKGSTPEKIVITLNGISFTVDLYPGEWPLSGNLYYCDSCSNCQLYINNGKSILLYLFRPFTVDKDPCLDIHGDGNGFIIYGGGITINGYGSRVFARFNNASGFVLKNIVISNFDVAIEVNHSNVSIGTILTDNVDTVIYLHDPESTDSYNFEATDIMYGDQKLFFLKPGYGTSFSLFYPLAVWAANFLTGGTIDGDGKTLQKVYPPVAILNSNNLLLENFSLTSSYPHGVIILNSSDITLRDATMNLNCSDVGVYLYNSSASIENVLIKTHSSLDALFSSSDITLTGVGITPP